MPRVRQVNLRAPQPEDAPAVLELIVARDVADLGHPDYTLDDVEADWASPEVDLALDAWLAENGDGLLGYALLDERGTVLVTVPPASEGGGVGTMLREAAEARAVARELGLIHQYVPASNEGARAHLRRAGYSPAYRYLRMRIDLAHAPEPPADVPVRTYNRGADDGPVHELVEAAMADVPGSRPQSVESWRAAKLDKDGWDPSLWLLHEDADGLAGAALRALRQRRRLGRVPRCRGAVARARRGPSLAAARAGGAPRGGLDGGRAVRPSREHRRDPALRVGRHAPGLDERAVGQVARRGVIARHQSRWVKRWAASDTLTDA